MTKAPSPLATPLAWDLVAKAYAEVNLEHFTRYANDALDFAAVRRGERVLDVATGPGTLAFAAAARGCEVAALDFSEAMLAQLRKKLAALGTLHVDARAGDGQKLPWAEGSFDAAFSMFGLMFFPDRASGFEELFRVLVPGGRAVVSSWQPMSKVPLLAAIFDALAAEMPGLPVGGEAGPLTDPGAFREEMEAAGFDVTVVPSVHTLDAPDVGAFWADARRSTAPLVLLERKLGAEAFAPIAAGIERRLRALFPGPVRAEMPAWLALGVKPA